MNKKLAEKNGIKESSFNPIDRIAFLEAKIDALMDYQGLKIKSINDKQFKVVKESKK